MPVRYARPPQCAFRPHAPRPPLSVYIYRVVAAPPQEEERRERYVCTAGEHTDGADDRKWDWKTPRIAIRHCDGVPPLMYAGATDGSTWVVGGGGGRVSLLSSSPLSSSPHWYTRLSLVSTAHSSPLYCLSTASLLYSIMLYTTLLVLCSESALSSPPLLLPPTAPLYCSSLLLLRQMRPEADSLPTRSRTTRRTPHSNQQYAPQTQARTSGRAAGASRRA